MSIRWPSNPLRHRYLGVHLPIYLLAASCRLAMRTFAYSRRPTSPALFLQGTTCNLPSLATTHSLSVSVQSTQRVRTLLHKFDNEVGRRMHGSSSSGAIWKGGGGTDNQQLLQQQQDLLQMHIVDLPELRGAQICICPCPGKRQRDLALDLNRLSEWGAQAVVTLIENSEMKMLQVPQIGEEVERRGMRWLHCPITDFSAPSEPFETPWRSAGREVRKILRGGGKIVVHCRGGIGRAGTVTSRLLLELGLVASAQDALIRVRKSRPGAVETIEQEQHLETVQRITDKEEDDGEGDFNEQ